MRRLATASQQLETSSRTKMSRSEYSHFLMIGKKFSVCIESCPFSTLMLLIPPYLKLYKFHYEFYYSTAGREVKKNLALSMAEC